MRLTADGTHRQLQAVVSVGTPGASAMLATIPIELLRSASADAWQEPRCSQALRWVLAMVATPSDKDEA